MKLIKMELRVNGRPDEKLVKDALEGHVEGFEALFNKYWKMMVGLAYSVLGDFQLAEDAASEAFKRACIMLPRLRRKYRFGVWLGRICKNVAKEIQYSRRREERVMATSIQQRTANPHIKNMDNDALYCAIGSLTPTESEVIFLRYFDGFSHAQISEVLGISPYAVNGRLVRAKGKIKKYLNASSLIGINHVLF